MVDDKNADRAVVEKASEMTAPHEESKSLAGLADEYLKELFSNAKIGAKKSEAVTPANKDPDNYNYGGDTQSGDSKSAAKGLQVLFDKAKNPTAGANKLESFDGGNGELRVLPGRDGGNSTGQYVDASGKTTTRISENSCVEYDPKTQQYTNIDQNGKRTVMKDSDPVDPSDKNNKTTLKDLKEKGVAKEKADDGLDGTKTTYLDGRVTTTFNEPSRLSERTSFPPGYRSDNPNDKGENAGLRQIENFRAAKPGESAAGDTATSSGARTVKTFEDRKETSFDSPDSKISKITAFKNPDGAHPAVITNYRNNQGPDGASSVETYKSDGRPTGIKQIAKFHDAQEKEKQPDKITFNNGVTLDSAPNGDIRTPIGSGDRTGILDLNKDSGMPTHMKIGDNDYKIGYDKDGKVNNMTVESQGPPPSKLVLERNPNTKDLEVKNADGKFKPDANGKVNLDGIPVGIKDGKVDGQLQLNKDGDLRYVDNGGPERHEIVRRANGSKEDYDFKNWTKTTTGADGQVKQPVDRWDGYKWRGDGAPSADGKRVDFPDGTFTERKTSGNPPQDVTVFGTKDGKPETYDWLNGTRSQVGDNGQEVKSYYDGSSYRAGTEQKLPNGDTSIKFTQPVKDDQPNESLRHKDGSLSNNFNDGTVVDRNPQGQVSEVNGPKGHLKFERDADGDIAKVNEYNGDGSLKNTLTRTGQYKDVPGFEDWLGREGNGAARQPGDAPPRDPNTPQDYNSWKSTTPVNANTSVEYDPTNKSYTRIAKDGTRTALADDNAKLDPNDPKSKTLGELKRERASAPNNDSMNVNTTADGTVRFERAARGDKAAETTVRPPAGDRYRDTPTQRVIDRPGGVTETVDKTKNPPESSLDFVRNGKPIHLNSKDGDYVVGQDGTVRQDSPDHKSNTNYFADGSVAKIALDANNKPAVTELSIAKNDPNKPGDSLTYKPGSPPCKSLELSGNAFKAVITDASGRDIPTVLNPARGLKQEQLPGEQFNRVSALASGKPLGLTNLQGAAILQFSDDGKTATSSSGRTYDATKWDLNPSHVQKGPNGEPVIKGIDGKNQALFKPSGAVVESINGKDTTVFPNKTEASYENGKLKTVKIGGKDFDPVLNDKGEVLSLKPKPSGAEIKPIPEGVAYTLNDKGVFVSDTKDDKTGVLTHMEWGPDEGKAYVERNWPTSDGKNSVTTTGWVTDASGNVSKFRLPGASSVDVATEQGANPKFAAKYNSKDGSLTVTIDENRSMVLNKDGSTDFQMKGGNSAPDVVQHRDRDRNLVPNDQQSASLSKLADAAIADPNQQQKLATELMRNVGTKQDLTTFMQSLNNGALKSLGIAISIQPGAAGKNNLVVSKNGKTFTVPVTLPST